MKLQFTTSSKRVKTERGFVLFPGYTGTKGITGNYILQRSPATQTEAEQEAEWRALVLKNWSLIDMWVSGTTWIWGGSNPALFPIDQCVTRPVYSEQDAFYQSTVSAKWPASSLQIVGQLRVPEETREKQHFLCLVPQHSFIPQTGFIFYSAVSCETNIEPSLIL